MSKNPPNYAAYRLIDIKNGILEARKRLNISRMPKHQELIDLGMRWLSKKISEYGGSEQWAELLEIQTERLSVSSGKKPPGWWNEERVFMELRPYVKRLSRMPTTQELNALSRGDLTNAIRRNGGFQFFADKFGVKKKRTATSKAERVEKAVKKFLEYNGFNVELTTSKCSYDLLIDKSIRVDVKMATNDDKNKYFMFFLRSKGLKPTCDAYALCRCARSKDVIYDIYFIPALMTQQQTITITPSEKWQPWKNNYEMLRNLGLFNKQQPKLL